MQDQPQSKRPYLLIGILLVAIVLIPLAYLFGKGTLSVSYNETPAATEEPTAVLNDCEMCGSESVVGTWTDETGRTISFANDNTFTITNDTRTITGTFDRSDDEICVTAAEGNQTAAYCYDYIKNVDALTLDDVTYIRR